MAESYDHLQGEEQDVSSHSTTPLGIASNPSAKMGDIASTGQLKQNYRSYQESPRTKVEKWNAPKQGVDGNAVGSLSIY